jgi:MFS family permease
MRPLGLTGYHWLVLAAAWLGWGFDVFDALLFNFVAPNAVPTLLDLRIGSPEARQATLFWTGVLTSILLVGWAAGGLIFGWFGDRYARPRRKCGSSCSSARSQASASVASGPLVLHW